MNLLEVVKEMAANPCVNDCQKNSCLSCKAQFALSMYNINEAATCCVDTWIKPKPKPYDETIWKPSYRAMSTGDLITSFNDCSFSLSNSRTGSSRFYCTMYNYKKTKGGSASSFSALDAILKARFLMAIGEHGTHEWKDEYYKIWHS